MKNNLPPLDQVLLNRIFAGVYGGGGQPPESGRTEHASVPALIDTLYAMQRFNYRFRPDDTRRLFDLFDELLNFELNSEGTTLWLSLTLAIQELYGLSDSKLIEVMGAGIISK